MEFHYNYISIKAEICIDSQSLKMNALVLITHCVRNIFPKLAIIMLITSILSAIRYE